MGMKRKSRQRRQCECKMQNAKCRIRVFSLEILETVRKADTTILHFEFSVLHSKN